MQEMKYVYGPVPSRRLGLSLGISPIPPKYCNYSCIYCQLGRTNHMTNTRQMFFPLEDILKEFDQTCGKGVSFDVVTIVGEGEPTLYKGLGELIRQVKQRTEKPVAVITNGALLYDKEVRKELGEADIVLPTLDAYDEASLKQINRPHGTISFEKVLQGLKEFAAEYSGQLWIELMLIQGVNADEASLEKYKALLEQIPYERLYINTPVRPPAEASVKAISPEEMERAIAVLGGSSIEFLESAGFHSEEKDDYAAIMALIRRHPMNQFEIEGFLESRACSDRKAIFSRLEQDPGVEKIEYKGYITFRRSAAISG